MAKSQNTRRQKNIARLVRDQRALAKDKIKFRRGYK